MVVSVGDKELTDNDMVYKLASPSRVKDVSWVKPGKVVYMYGQLACVVNGMAYCHVMGW